MSGTAIALATANEVITQVPGRGDARDRPPIAGHRHVRDRRVEHVHERGERQREGAEDLRCTCERLDLPGVGHRGPSGRQRLGQATGLSRRVRRMVGAHQHVHAGDHE